MDATRILLVTILFVGFSSAVDNTEIYRILYQGEELLGNSINVMEGDQVTLTCLEKSNNSSADTEWDSPDMADFLQNAKNLYQFTIPKVLRNNSGNYRCSFKLPGVKAATYGPRTILMEVLYPPSELSIEAPSEVKKNTEVKLNCSVNSYPPATYTWRKDSLQNTSAISTDQTITVNITEETIIYCTARQTMELTHGCSVETIISVMHIIRIQDTVSSLNDNVPADSNSNNSSLIVATVFGWVVVVGLLAVLGTVLYLWRRNGKGYNLFARRKPRLELPRSVKCSSDEGTVVMTTTSPPLNESSVDKGSDEEHPKLPGRNPLPAPRKKNYLELQTPEQSKENENTDDTYETLEETVRYDYVEAPEIDTRQSAFTDGYLVPLESKKCKVKEFL